MNETLKSLEDLYLKKEYKQVRDKLLAMKSDLDAGVFHYNLGTVYGKLGDYAAGRYNLELALKKGFNNSKVYKNLNFFQKQIPVLDIDSSPSYFDKFISFGASASSGIFLSFTLIMSLIILIYIKKKTLNNLKIIAALFVISLVPIGSYFFYFSSLKTGVLLNQSELREGPSKVYEQIDELTAGTKLIFGEENSGWIMIERPNNYTGWVEVNKIGFIKD